MMIMSLEGLILSKAGDVYKLPSSVICHSQRFKFKLNIGVRLVISVVRCIANWGWRVEVYDDEG
jgi:hypothetical protein